MLRSGTVCRRILCTASMVALASTAALADGYGDGQQRPSHASKRLHFTAPPSQLREPWRCSWSDGYAAPMAARPCPYAPRYTHDFLLDPYVAQRLMPPLRPVPPPGSADSPPPYPPTIPPTAPANPEPMIPPSTQRQTP